ncbi:S1 family peptidase [Streptomyces sp. NPDC006512]|uniref:S1 family peptidase n=1 Tax=Streptomyces sp. NPDC006512 TaxID=3154307 RepID=UPI0033BD63C9
MHVLRPRTAQMTCLLATATATAVAAGLVSAGPAVALHGPEALAGQHAYVVKLNIGDETNSRACAGTLVDASWVLTAASCFGATPGDAVPAGKPALKAVVTLGDAKTVEVSELVPRTDRDVVLARLATPTTGIAGVKRANSAPAAGAELTAAGFGRTKTEWVPGKLHTGTFTTNSSTATTLAVTGKGADVLCKGDTGGPLLNAAGELVGVNSRSWQGGCLGTDAAETRTGAISARTDDLGQWIHDHTFVAAATVGVHRPADSTFYKADRSGKLSGQAVFGAQGDVPLTGDWNRDKKDTFGVYRPSDQGFYLSDDNLSVAVARKFGNPGDVPLVGDWDGDGVDTIGVYRPSDLSFNLSNDNVSVAYSLVMGVDGDTPMVGDWNGDGKDTIGVYRSSDTTFYLTDSQTSAPVDHKVKFGNPGDVPIKGDWNGDGTDKVGIHRPAESGFYGAAKDSDTVIYNVRFGNPTDNPIIGQW